MVMSKWILDSKTVWDSPVEYKLPAIWNGTFQKKVETVDRESKQTPGDLRYKNDWSARCTPYFRV